MALRHDAVRQQRKAEFIPATLETAKYDGKIWGVPKQSDAAFLYYSTDQVEEAPATWQEVYEQAAENDGIVYQGAAYEGLTCDFLEIAFAAGGKVLSEDGNKADVRLAGEPQGARSSWSTAITNGAAPKAVTTYMEERGAPRLRGRQRDVPCATGRTRTRRPEERQEKGKFEVAPFPEFEGGGKAGILGGDNLVISVTPRTRAAR